MCVCLCVLFILLLLKCCSSRGEATPRRTNVVFVCNDRFIWRCGAWGHLPETAVQSFSHLKSAKVILLFSGTNANHCQRQGNECKQFNDTCFILFITCNVFNWKIMSMLHFCLFILNGKVFSLCSCLNFSHTVSSMYHLSDTYFDWIVLAVYFVAAVFDNYN